MDVVIQCAGGKSNLARYFHADNGKTVRFVGRPDLTTAGNDIVARPDDPSDRKGLSWRQKVEQYGKSNDGNPYRLAKAYQLYKPPAYAALVREFGEKRVFILSAGWGLLRADFLVPSYDITFSKKARAESPWTYRDNRKDHYEDFQQLSSRSTGPIVFLGGKDYIKLFRSLTKPLGRHSIVFQRAAPENRVSADRSENGLEYRSFVTPILTNWHYQCAKELADGTVSI